MTNNTREVGVGYGREQTETVTAPVQTTDMEFVVGIPHLDKRYAKYLDKGGKLSLERCVGVLELLRDFTEADKVPDSERSLARDMAQYAGLELTDAEVYAYKKLRSIMRSEVVAEMSQPPQTDVYNLMDQELLKQILLIQGKSAEYKKFTIAYSADDPRRKTELDLKF